MARLLVILLSFFLAFAGYSAAQESPDSPDNQAMERTLKSLQQTQERLHEDYRSLLLRMRVQAQKESDEQAKERLAKAVAMMDELAIAHEMEKLSDLIQNQAFAAAASKANTISEHITKILQILDGIDPDWKPDPRIPTLQEQIDRLAELGNIQRELREQTGSMGEKPELNPDDQFKLDQLKSRQRELDRQTRELAEILPDDLKPLMDQASEAMDQALEQLNQGNLDNAENLQQEAEDRLDEVQRELENKLREYRDIENQNLLLHVEMEIEKLRKEQVRVNKLTIETQQRTENGERLSRRDWYNVAVGQIQNSKVAKDLAEKLIHGNVPIFGRIMEGVGRDMDKCGDLLRGKDAGEFTQSIQEDVLTRLNDLLDALHAERTRRQNEGGDPPQQTSPDGKSPEPRLVPLPAELGILLKRQQYLRQKHERFMERFPNVKDRAAMSEAQRRIYERLSQEQGENAGYLDSLLDALFNKG